MIRILFLAVLIYYIVRLVRRFSACKRNAVSQAQCNQAARSDFSNEMVKCARCSTYINKSTAISKKGEWICPDNCQE